MLNVKSEALADNKVKLTVEVDAARVDEAIDKVYKQLAKEVRIPGFRPGKAPRAMITKMVGEEYALDQAAEDIINETYSQSVDSQRLRPVANPEFPELDPVVAGENYTYETTVEVRPSFTLSDTDIEIVMPPREVMDSEIDEQIEAYRDRMANLEPAKDREIKEDDFLNISFTSTLDGEEYEDNSVNSQMYELGKGMMPDEFEAAIVGAKSGDEVVAEFVVPDAGTNEEFAGKTIRFEITINEVLDKVLPEVNDEFASTAGFETLEEMREEIKSYITSQKEESYDRVQDERLVSALSEKLEGETPKAMIDERKQTLHNDLLRMLKNNKLEFEQYLELSGITAERYNEDLEIQADILARNDLSLETLAEQLELGVTDEEIEAEFDEIADMLKMDKEAARKRWIEYGLVTSVIDEISRKKALEWLRSNSAVVIEEGSN